MLEVGEESLRYWIGSMDGVSGYGEGEASWRGNEGFAFR
jgi:hypothetical protein